MSKRQQWKRYRGGGWDPWEHNRTVAQRRAFRDLARASKRAERSLDRLARELGLLGGTFRRLWLNDWTRS